MYRAVYTDDRGVLHFAVALVRAASALALALTSSAAFAQTSVGEIQNAANRTGDKSMALLELVFGSIVRNPLSASGGAGGGMLASIFLVITSCILAVGVIWAIYHFASSMIATGQDGEFLGQKKSSPWFMIRMVVGFCSLVPIFGGYCGAQVVMLWATMMGVGVANLTQDATIAVLKSGGSMVATPAAPAANTLAQALFEANLCGESVNTAITQMPAESGVSADAAERFSPSVSSKSINIVNGRGQSCGGAKLELPQPVSMTGGAESIAGYGLDTSTLYGPMQSAHEAGLSTMQSTLSALAQQYVNAVNGGSAPPDVSAALASAAQAYENTIRQAIAGSRGSIDSLTSRIEQNLKRDGWIMTGAWYQTFAQANAQATALANATAAGIAGTDTNNLAYPQLYRKVLSAYQQQRAKDGSSASSTANAVAALKTESTDAKGFVASIFSGQEWVKAAINLNGNNGGGGTTNPMIGMKNLGDYILMGGWGALGTYTAIKGGLAAADSTLGKAATAVADAVTFGAAGALKKAALGVLDALGPFIIVALLSLFFFGAMLSIYIPMVPFIVWFGGVTSWYAVVGEALIASPLWGITHLDGDGEGVGQRSTHGYIFLLNVLFRPALMMVGFALGGAGVIVLGTLLNTMFGVAMANAQFDSTTGLVSIIGFIALYVGLCLTLIHGCFNLIHVVPDQVFSWVGGHMAGQVGRDTEDRAKHVFVGGVATGKDAARNSMAGMGRAPRAAPGPKPPKAPSGDHPSRPPSF
ncbi:DotA/TraY family protein [Cupriavidus nantongensis]|uniref:DotA/TraY family protein n=1 Tax=Cupriavidus nantongensis TaxID=1796606 RepID=UPI0009EEFD05|nr:DotA/TraY family protein [Cupriavidus nantongensis]